MNRFFVVISCLLVLFVEARAQSAGQPNAGSRLTYSGTTGVYDLSWWGASGNTYLVEVSDDLVNWSYFNLVEGGSNAILGYAFTSTSSNAFARVEYITVPPAQLSGTSLHGTLDPASGLPEDWELFYYGHTNVSASATVAWSGGSMTNLQAYQAGLNPVDYYSGNSPSMSVVGSSSISSTGGQIFVSVEDASNNPLIDAPVSWTINYGGVEPSGSTSYAQSVSSLTNADGIATIDVLPPWWANSDYTVTASAAEHSSASSQFAGATATLTANYPNPPAVSTVTSINLPTAQIQLTSTSASNPAFKQLQVYNSTTGQFSDSPPINWYLVQTESSSESKSYWINNNPNDLTETGTDSYFTVGTAHPPNNPPTYTGTSTWFESDFDGNGHNTGGESDITTPTYSGGPLLWTGTLSWWSTGDQATSESVSVPPFTPYQSPTTPPGQTFTQTTTQLNASLSGSSGGARFQYAHSISLSQQYTTSQFCSDVIAALPSETSSNGNYTFGNPIASWNLASDSSSFGVQYADYTMNTPVSGTTPFEFEWYEAFRPTDPSQPITLQHREWDNAVQQAQSQNFSIHPTYGQTNGTWSLIKMEVDEQATVPACQWRHSLGAGELADVYAVQGFGAAISGSIQWTATGGTLKQDFNSPPIQTATGVSCVFTAGTGGPASITATLPGGATMTTNLVVVTPTGVAMTWVSFDDGNFNSGDIGAGFYPYWTVLPTNVSFGNIMTAERSVNASNVTGFFSTGAPQHNPNGVSVLGAAYSSNLPYDWTQIRVDNTSSVTDWVAEELNGSNNGQAGGFEWDIPWVWKLTSDTSSSQVMQFPQPVVATFSINIFGMTTATKAGVTVTRFSTGQETHQP
jgi:hypothetical protein